MTLSVAIGSTELKDDYLEVLQQSWDEDSSNIKIMITRHQLKDDEINDVYTAEEMTSIIVDYRELLRAISAVVD